MPKSKKVIKAKKPNRNHSKPQEQATNDPQNDSQQIELNRSEYSPTTHPNNTTQQNENKMIDIQEPPKIEPEDGPIKYNFMSPPENYQSGKQSKKPKEKLMNMLFEDESQQIDLFNYHNNLNARFNSKTISKQTEGENFSVGKEFLKKEMDIAAGIQPPPPKWTNNWAKNAHSEFGKAFNRIDTEEESQKSANYSLHDSQDQLHNNLVGTYKHVQFRNNQPDQANEAHEGNSNNATTVSGAKGFKAKDFMVDVNKLSGGEYQSIAEKRLLEKKLEQEKRKVPMKKKLKLDDQIVELDRLREVNEFQIVQEFGYDDIYKVFMKESGQKYQASPVMILTKNRKPRCLSTGLCVLIVNFWYMMLRFFVSFFGIWNWCGESISGCCNDLTKKCEKPRPTLYRTMIRTDVPATDLEGHHSKYRWKYKDMDMNDDLLNYRPNVKELPIQYETIIDLESDPQPDKEKKGEESDFVFVLKDDERKSEFVMNRYGTCFCLREIDLIQNPNFELFKVRTDPISEFKNCRWGVCCTCHTQGIPVNDEIISNFWLRQICTCSIFASLLNFLVKPCSSITCCITGKYNIVDGRNQEIGKLTRVNKSMGEVYKVEFTRKMSSRSKLIFFATFLIPNKEHIFINLTIFAIIIGIISAVVIASLEGGKTLSDIFRL